MRVTTIEEQSIKKQARGRVSRHPSVAKREEPSIKELNAILGIGKVQAVDNLVIDRIVRKRLPAGVSDKIKKAFLITDAELVKVAGVTLRTFQRKRAERKKFSLLVSDRIARLTSILSFATQVFEDSESATAWMRKPQIALGGQKPIDLIETEAGENAVKDLLGRIEYGVIS